VIAPELQGLADLGLVRVQVVRAADSALDVAEGGLGDLVPDADP